MNVTNETKDLLIMKQIEKNIDYFFKKGLLQLIAAFKMREMVMISKDGFPYSNI